MFPHCAQSSANKLSPAMLFPVPYGMSSSFSAGNKTDGANNNPGSCGVGYDIPASMLPVSNSNFNNQHPPFVILPRVDLELLKQEVTSLKNSIVKFRTVVSGEIQKLRVESEALHRLVETSQKCVCKQNGGRNEQQSQEQQCYSAWEGVTSNSAHTVDNLSTRCALVPCSSSTPRAGVPSTSTGLPCTAEPSAVSCTSLPGTISGTQSFSQSCTSELGSYDNICVSAGFDYLNTQQDSEDLPGFSTYSNQSDVSSATDNKPLTQLLPCYDVYVDKLTLQIILNEAQTRKDGGALFVLRRIIPLVFTWEELASSRGQGLNGKTADSVSNKYPLDPTRVMVCKSYMRKFCLDFDCEEPSDKSVNQTFNHQVKYSRRRIKTVRPPTDGRSTVGLSNSNSLTGRYVAGVRKTKKAGGVKGRTVGWTNLRY